MKKSNVDGLAGILKGLSAPQPMMQLSRVGESAVSQSANKPQIQIAPIKRPSKEQEVMEKAQELKEERRGPGRPPGKRSDPNFDRMTVLVRKDTLDELDMMLLKDKNGPQDRSELVEILLRNHLQGRTANNLG